MPCWKALRVDVATAHGPASWQRRAFRAPHARLRPRSGSCSKRRANRFSPGTIEKGLQHGFEFVPALLARERGRRRRTARRASTSSSMALRRRPSRVAHSELHHAPRSRRGRTRRRLHGRRRASGAGAAHGDGRGDLQDAAEGHAGAGRGRGTPCSPGRSDWRKAAESLAPAFGRASTSPSSTSPGARREASGTGLLTLDRAQRPQGLIKLKIAGYQALAKEAERRHLVQGAQEGVLAGADG